MLEGADANFVVVHCWAYNSPTCEKPNLLGNATLLKELKTEYFEKTTRMDGIKFDLVIGKYIGP